MKKYNKIQLTQQDFLNIENAFHFFVDNCNLTQKEQDSIILTHKNIISQLLQTKPKTS